MGRLKEHLFWLMCVALFAQAEKVNEKTATCDTTILVPGTPVPNTPVPGASVSGNSAQNSSSAMSMDSGAAGIPAQKTVVSAPNHSDTGPSGPALDSTGAKPSSQPWPRIPDGYRLPSPVLEECSAGDYCIRLYAQEFAQGNAVYVEILPQPGLIKVDTAITLWFDNRQVLLAARSWGYRGLFPIAPDEPPGDKTLSLKVTRGLPAQYDFYISISETSFPKSHFRIRSRVYIDTGRIDVSPVELFIEDCSRKKQELLHRQSSDKLTGKFAFPRDRFGITSAYWSTRTYDYYEIIKGKKVRYPPEKKFHRGIDLWGRRGEPVFALADGEVAIAEKMYYEGNFTAIDHGNKIMSYYMHQNTILVHPGQMVKAGDPIGTVGSTGTSTAPHLHLSLVIDSIQVDPLSILPLPMR